MQTHSYTVIILGSGSKRFAIYTDPSVGHTLQMFLTDVKKSRPLTHDLLDMIFDGYGIRVKQVVINDVQDTIYLCRLFLEQQNGGIRHILEIDARPSDCITIALMCNAPVYCTKEVFENTVAVED